MKNFKNLPYRKGVGMMVFNDQKKIFVGKRIDNEKAWQMPQGGVDENENFEIAAKRELFEETGVKSINFICESNKWHYYYLPKFLSKKLWKGKFKGQKQKWFAFEFIGKDDEININPEDIKPEFCNWKWVSPNNICKLIINFKVIFYFVI